MLTPPSSPVYLAAAVTLDPSLKTASSVAVCYSDTAAGSNSNLAGGVAAVYFPFNTVSSPYGDTWCASDSTSLLQVACNVGTWPTYHVAPGGIAGDTVSLAVPFGYCIGSNLTGTACSAPTGGPAVGATGLIITGVGIGGAPGGTATGATATPGGTLSIDGVIQVPFAQAAGVGVNLGSGFGPNVPVCAVFCLNAPSAWAGLPAGPAPLGDITVAGANLAIPNVLTAPACVSTPGSVCPTPY